MANTERLNTLQFVIDAMEEVKAKQGRIKDKQSSKFQALQRAYMTLSEAHEDLVYEDIKQTVDDIGAAAKKLKGITKQMREDLEGLKAVAKTIEKAAIALGALAEIVSKAASAGIL